MSQPYFEGNGITIWHGDALDILPDLSGVGAVITDPPYSSGGAFRGDRMQKTVSKYQTAGVQNVGAEFAGDTRDQRSYAVWCALWMNAARHASNEGALIACFSDWRQLPTVTDALQCGGWVWRGIATWSKKFGRPRNGGWSSACEFLPWGTNGGLVENNLYPAGIFEATSPSTAEREHLAQKPEAVMSWAMAAVPPAALVLDPFMGTGTTLVAACRRGLPAIGIEVLERNCEIAARRLQQGSLFGATDDSIDSRAGL